MFFFSCTYNGAESHVTYERFENAVFILWFTYYVSGQLNDHLSGKELSSTFRKLLLIYVFSYFPFSFEGRVWDLIAYLFTLKMFELHIVIWGDCCVSSHVEVP